VTEHFADIHASGLGAAKIRQRLFGTDVANGPVTVGDLALLANAVYEEFGDGHDKDYVPSDLNGCAIPVWTCVTTFNFQFNKDLHALLAPNSEDATEQKVDGFFAALFTDGTNAPLGKNGQHYVLAFRGTDKTQLEDWVTDLRQAFGLYTWQYANAAQIVAEELPKYVDSEAAQTLTFTGHSLGGGLASLASSMVPQIPTITFNAVGLHERTKALANRYAQVGTQWDRLRHPSLGGVEVMPSLWNYHVANEVLTTLQEDPSRLLGRYTRMTGTGAGVAAILGALSLVDIPKASRHHHLIPGVREKSVINRHMMGVVLSALGVSGVNADKLTFADATLSAFDAPDPEALWCGGDAPPPPSPPPTLTPAPPNSVGSTSSDADDE
jgi:hypothetical protein